jgi:dolichyl-phosphate beta-glucosyltransferase
LKNNPDSLQKYPVVGNDPIQISIIIPCWNEQKNLERGVLAEVENYLCGLSLGWEVIIVDDGSTDLSPALIAEFVRSRDRFGLISAVHKGKPSAIWTGIQQARGELILFTDMDQSTPIQELERLLPWYQEDYQVVIGSRGLRRDGTTFLRKLGSFLFLSLRQLILLPNLQDTQCGFKSCRREAALQVFPKLTALQQDGAPVGWKVTAYDVELLYLMERSGLRIKEVQVEWRNRDLSTTKTEGQSRNAYLKESIEMAREVVRVKLNQVKGIYD